MATKDSFNRFQSINGYTKLMLICVCVAVVNILIGGIFDKVWATWIMIVSIALAIIVWLISYISYKQYLKEE